MVGLSVVSLEKQLASASPDLFDVRVLTAWTMEETVQLGSLSTMLCVSCLLRAARRQDRGWHRSQVTLAVVDVVNILSIDLAKIGTYALDSIKTGQYRYTKR